MATYAVQFITSNGALCGQTITNRTRAVELVNNSWSGTNIAVSILVVGGSFKERTRLGDLAVSDVFFQRKPALEFLNKLGEEDV